MVEKSLWKRLKAAFNVAYTGRFVQLDRDGFPVHSFPTASGKSIGPETALYSTAVFSCVNLIASSIASMPLTLYQKQKNGDIQEAETNPLYWLLSYKPNRLQTAYEYWLYNVECILLRGGFISWVNRSPTTGKILSLIALHPDTVTRELSPSGEMLISGMAQWGPSNNYLKFEKEKQENFFWSNYRTRDGVNPCSPITYAAESIGLAITAEEHGARTFENDAVPPIVVSTVGKLNEEHLKNLAAMWKAGGSGNNYGMPRFMDDGAKIERLKMSNEDAQYLETRRFQREDICGIFRVPPSMIGDTARAQGWSTLSQKNSDFLAYCLSPYLTNIEESVNRSLIPESDWGRVYSDFQTKALMRADVNTRMEYYTSMRSNGALSPNEIRIEEGYNKRPGGDDFSVSTAPATPKPQPKETQIIQEEQP